MKKRRNIMKEKIVPLILTVAISITLLPDIVTMEAKAGNLSNPRRNSAGIVTYDCVYFGSYPQSDATGNTKEPIKWRVLSVKGNDAFLVADKNLDVQQYHDTYIPSYTKEKYPLWEDCTLRSWLNGYGSSANRSKKDYSINNFIDKAFSDAEQQAIFITKINNENNPAFGIDGGSNTNDKIFLLSYEEVTNPSYGFDADVESDTARERQNTAYVAAGGEIQSEYMEGAGHTDEWYLRTPGGYSGRAMDICEDGYVHLSGNFKSSLSEAVCPALHLNLSYSAYYTYGGTVSCANNRPVRYYNIKYVLNGGKNGENPAKYSEYAPANITLKAPKRAGYSFGGWYTDKACKKKVTSIKVSWQKNITLYAKWTKVSKPDRVVIKDVSNKKKGCVKLFLGKVKGADGYEVQYSTDKKLKKSIKKFIMKGTTKTIKDLKKSKTYYIKARAYKTDSAGKKVYGSYSYIKKVKVVS